MLFDLNEPEIIAHEEPEEAETTVDVAEEVAEGEEKAEKPARKLPSKIITLYPLSWADSFGDEAGKIHLLEGGKVFRKLGCTAACKDR